MKSSRKYMMWGMVPVRFEAHGAWEVAVGSPLGKAAMTTLAYTLLQVNRTVERLLNEQIEFRVPLVPMEQATLYKLAHAFRQPPDRATSP